MAVDVASEIDIQPIAGALGAEIHGLDLRQSITDDKFQLIHDALVKYQVIFFRDQDIDPVHHKNLAMLFGKPHAHPAYPNPEGFPEIVKLISTPEVPTKIEKWHTDMTFMERPPLGSILHAKKIPTYGGDTLWSNMELAYDALSDKWQSFLSGLTAIHDFRVGFKESLAEPGGPERLKQAILDNPPISHPVIRKHPVSGRKCIFVNSLFTSHIEGMSETESKAILEFLYVHVQNPDFNCRFRWEENSIAFWDNRSTQHKPVNDYFPNYREMWRITILGDKPQA